MYVTFCEAIAREEGWLVLTSRARRNHNPGNMEYGEFARTHGAIASDGRFAIFPDDKAGFAAMSALLTKHYLGGTLEACVAKWAPPTENDTEKYIANVLAWTGHDPKTIMTAELLAPPLIA